MEANYFSLMIFQFVFQFDVYIYSLLQYRHHGTIFCWQRFGIVQNKNIILEISIWYYIPHLDDS